MNQQIKYISSRQNILYYLYILSICFIQAIEGNNKFNNIKKKLYKYKGKILNLRQNSKKLQ